VCTILVLSLLLLAWDWKHTTRTSIHELANGERIRRLIRGVRTVRCWFPAGLDGKHRVGVFVREEAEQVRGVGVTWRRRLTRRAGVSRTIARASRRVYLKRM